MTNQQNDKCMLGNFSFLSCHLLNLFKINFSKKTFRNTIRVSNGLDPDQDQRSVDLDLGPTVCKGLARKKLTLPVRLVC